MIPIPGTAYLLAAAFVAGAFSAYKVMDWKADAERTQQIEASLAVLDATHKAARASEQAHATETAKIATKLNQEKRNAKIQTDDLLRQLGDRTIVLRDPGAREPASNRSCPGDAPATAGRDNGTPAGDLSSEAAAFLFQLTGEADTVALQLAACQALILEDRAKK